MSPGLASPVTRDTHAAEHAFDGAIAVPSRPAIMVTSPMKSATQREFGRS